MNAALRIAERQYGAITRAQLRMEELSDAQIDRMIGNQIEVVHPGVYRVVGSVRSSRQRASAALLWLGRDAHLSLRTAGALLRLDGLRTRDVQVLVPPESRQGRGQHLVQIRRSILLPRDRRVADGLRCTSATRTLVDLAATLDDEALEAAFESARRMGLTTLTVVQHAIETGGRHPGLARLRRVISAAESRPKESRLEVKLARLLRGSSLPASVPQFELLAYRLDRAWPERKLAVEADGFQHHGRTQCRDRSRGRSASGARGAGRWQHFEQSHIASAASLGSNRNAKVRWRRD